MRESNLPLGRYTTHSTLSAVKWQYLGNKVLSLKCCAVLCYQRFVPWPSKETAVFNSAFFFLRLSLLPSGRCTSSGRKGAACTKTFKEALLHDLLEVKANILEIGSSFIVMWQILEDFINTLFFWSVFTKDWKRQNVASHIYASVRIINH